MQVQYGYDITGHVSSHDYPANSTICVNAIVYRNNAVMWDVPNKCEYRGSSGVVTSGFRIPGCASGTWEIRGWSWLSGNNTQPQADDLFFWNGTPYYP